MWTACTYNLSYDHVIIVLGEEKLFVPKKMSHESSIQLICNSWFRNFIWNLHYVMSLLQPNFAFFIETSHFMCAANQMTGFYIKCNSGLKWVNLHDRKGHLFSSKFQVTACESHKRSKYLPLQQNNCRYIIKWSSCVDLIKSCLNQLSY